MTRRVARWVVSTVGALTLAAFIVITGLEPAGEAVERARADV